LSSLPVAAEYVPWRYFQRLAFIDRAMTSVEHEEDR